MDRDNGGDDDPDSALQPIHEGGREATPHAPRSDSPPKQQPSVDAFGYVSVILSVVIGLGLSHLLTGWPKRAPGFVSTGYTSAGFLVSKGEPDKAIDLRAYFYENRGGFFGTSAAFTALLSVENWLLTGRGSPATVTATLVVCIVLPDASAVVKSTRYHAAVALLFVALFLAFILMFGLRLGAH